MRIFLPDTNILLDAFRKKRGRRELLTRLVAEGNTLACCDITVGEIYSGMQPHEAERTDAFLSALVWFNTNRVIARRAGRLRYDYARQGITLGIADTLLAATALEHGLTLITANREDFPMPELLLHPTESQQS